MILSFTHRHAVGTVCAPVCKQCGEEPARVGQLWIGGVRVPRQPLVIVRETTKKAYIEDQIARYGSMYGSPVGPYYYEVCTD